MTTIISKQNLYVYIPVRDITILTPLIVVNVFLKRIWYACFGALHGKAKQALGKMNRLLDEAPLLRDADPRWLSADARRFGETFARIESWRARQICRWLQAYGEEPFRDIAMWNVDWAHLTRRFRHDGDETQLTLADFEGVDFTGVDFMSGVAKQAGERNNNNNNDGLHYRRLDELEKQLVGIRPKHIPHKK